MAATWPDPFAWTVAAPASAEIGDHDVPLLSRHLEGCEVALLVCGGIAAFRTPQLARALRRRGATVTAFVSEEALAYVGAQALEWACGRPLVRQLSWRAEHLGASEALKPSAVAGPDLPGGAPGAVQPTGRCFDAYLVAPATVNTIAKLAVGIADTLPTAVLAAALGRLAQGRTRVLVAPTLHGSLHSPVFAANCRRLQELGVELIPPRDAYGKHNLPDEELLVAAVGRSLSRSPLRGRRVLVTGGPTPVPLDGVRRLTSRFSGQLGAAIQEELLRRGAASTLVLGDSGWRPAAWIPYRLAATYADYQRLVLEEVQAGAEAAVLSAAVADYGPEQAVAGKIASGAPRLDLTLRPLAKVLDAVAAAAPRMPLVSFKYLEGVSHDDLIAEARRRLDRSSLVVANRGEEITATCQVAWLVDREGEQRVEGKAAIASALADRLEQLLR